METTVTTKLELERETCGRCGGSGRYSYNQIDGDRCYGCHGKGRRYTKRGAVAAEFLRALRSVRADSIKVGDLIETGGMTGGAAIFHYFAHVTEIKAAVQRYKSGPACNDPDAPWQEAPVIEIHTTHEKYGAVCHVSYPATMIRKGWTAEEKAAQLLQAIAYQATLTKAGKPRKGGTPS
jgi:hypothetical protein